MTADIQTQCDVGGSRRPTTHICCWGVCSHLEIFTAHVKQPLKKTKNLSLTGVCQTQNETLHSDHFYNWQIVFLFGVLIKLLQHLQSPRELVSLVPWLGLGWRRAIDSPPLILLTSKCRFTCNIFMGSRGEKRNKHIEEFLLCFLVFCYFTFLSLHWFVMCYWGGPCAKMIVWIIMLMCFSWEMNVTHKTPFLINIVSRDKAEDEINILFPSSLIQCYCGTDQMDWLD